MRSREGFQGLVILFIATLSRKLPPVRATFISSDGAAPPLHGAPDLTATSGVKLPACRFGGHTPSHSVFPTSLSFLPPLHRFHFCSISASR